MQYKDYGEGLDNGRITAFSTLSGAAVYEEAVTKSIIGRGDFTLHGQMQQGKLV